MQNVKFDYQNHYTDAQAALILKAVEFAFRELDIPMDTVLYIDVHNKNDRSGHYWNLRREISIPARKLDMILLDVLFHEIVHLCQYLTGRMKQSGRKTIWRDDSGQVRYFNTTLALALNGGDAYNNLPWEYEACHTAYDLVRKFVRTESGFETSAWKRLNIWLALPDRKLQNLLRWTVECVIVAIISTIILGFIIGFGKLLIYVVVIGSSLDFLGRYLPKPWGTYTDPIVEMKKAAEITGSEN